MAKNCFIGIDIGGTKTAIAKITVGGDIISLKKIATPANSSLDFLVDLVKKVGSAGLWGIGIGIAGLVDFNRQVFVDGPNLPNRWNRQSPCRLLAKTFQIPCVMDNDAHCFALGEARFGQAKGFDSVLGVTIGTGVGGGLVLDGRIHRGRNNAAGEIGHMTIDARAAAVCGCGQKGHLEALTSGQALVKRYRKLTGKTLSAQAISVAARKKNRAALKSITQTADSLSLGLASASYLLNPDIIVVGGGLANTAGLVVATKKLYKTHASVFEPIKKTPIVRSKLGPQANLLGAAALAMDKRASL